MKKLQTRQVNLSIMNRNTPQSLNEDEKSVEAVLTTEQPAEVWDWENGTVDEILLVSGANFPEVGQIPFLDNHNRKSIENVIGSVSNFKIEESQITGKVTFANVENGQKAFELVKQGHIKDVSIGYRIEDYKLIMPKTSLNVNGKDFTAGEKFLRVVTKYNLVEASLTPIGADKDAKIRSNDVALENNIVKQPEIDLEYLRKEAIDLERKRVSEIMGLCKSHDMESEDFISRGMTIEQVRESILNKIAQRRSSVQVKSPVVQVVREKEDGVRQFVENSLAVRMGMTPPHKEIESSRLSLTELARELFVANGIEMIDGMNIKRMGKADIARLCFRGAFSHSTSDFPNILSGTITRRLQDAYNEAPSTYQFWCNTVEVPDFKEYSVVKVSEGTDLELVPENAQYPEETYQESAESYKLDKYGKRFTISWEAITNDDLGHFQKIAVKQGNAARRKVNQVAYAVLTGNANMSDGKALFHTDHFNLANPGAVLSHDSLSAARAAMRNQKGMDGAILNIVGKYLLVPSELEVTAKQLMASLVVPGDNKGHALNVLQGEYQVIVEPILSTSTTGWFVAADWKQCDTVEIAFLEGHKEPFVDEEEGFIVDGRQYKVRMPVVAKAIDWRGLYMNDGTAQ